MSVVFLCVHLSFFWISFVVFKLFFLASFYSTPFILSPFLWSHFSRLDDHCFLGGEDGHGQEFPFVFFSSRIFKAFHILNIYMYNICEIFICPRRLHSKARFSFSRVFKRSVEPDSYMCLHQFLLKACAPLSCGRRKQYVTHHVHQQAKQDQEKDLTGSKPRQLLRRPLVDWQRLCVAGCISEPSAKRHPLGLFVVHIHLLAHASPDHSLGPFNRPSKFWPLCQHLVDAYVLCK